MSEPHQPHQPNEQNPYAAPPVTEDWMLQPLPLMGSVLQQGLQICGNNWITIAALVALVWGPIEFQSDAHAVCWTSHVPPSDIEARSLAGQGSAERDAKNHG